MYSNWFVYIILVVLLWAATGLIYKAGIHKEPEDHTAVKYSVSVGIVFFMISAIYLTMRDEPFSIFESAVRYWPMTASLICKFSCFSLYFLINFQIQPVQEESHNLL